MKKMKKFKCSVICFFSAMAVFLLILCSTTISLELRRKKDNTKTYFDCKRLQVFIAIIFNLSIVIAFVFVLKEFFIMLKRIGMKSQMKLLKAMLIVLATSFLIRAILAGVVIYSFEIVSNSKWTTFCTLLVTCYLFFGELVPIAFVFVYHILSGPQFSKEEL